MLSFALNDILIIVILSIVAVCDQVSESNLQVHIIAPFIMMARPEMDIEPPRMVYQGM